MRERAKASYDARGAAQRAVLQLHEAFECIEQTLDTASAKDVVTMREYLEFKKKNFEFREKANQFISDFGAACR